MVPALISFGKKYFGFHYFCKRHILEFYGTNSGLCMFVARFLLCYTQDQYEHERLLIKEKLNYL